MPVYIRGSHRPNSVIVMQFLNIFLYTKHLEFVLLPEIEKCVEHRLQIWGVLRTKPDIHSVWP